MQKVRTIENASPSTDNEYETAVNRYIIEIEQMRSDMAGSQLRIEQLRTETRKMLDETRHVLNKLSA